MSLRPASAQSAVHVTMQPLVPSSQAPPSPSHQQPGEAPLPLRWQQAVDNIQSAITSADQLAQALDGALYLDDDEWQKAIPVHKYNMALQVQHHRIAELERQVAELGSRLGESERQRAGAEQQIKELNGELENNARVFQLHYDELMRKEKEISDLQAVVQALSLGGGRGGSLGGGSLGAGGGGSSLGAGTSSDGDDAAIEFGSLRL